MKRVLICGDDLALLTVRAEVLRRASFHADIQMGLSAFQSLTPANAPDVIILCTSMNWSDRILAKTLIEERLPNVFVVTLLRSGEASTERGRFMRAIEGPSKLIQSITEMTKG